jgi:hypothetical protein
MEAERHRTAYLQLQAAQQVRQRPLRQRSRMGKAPLQPPVVLRLLLLLLLLLAWQLASEPVVLQQLALAQAVSEQP